MTENASKTLSYFDIHFDSRCFLEDESKLEHSNGRNFVVKMDSHTIDFFSRCTSFLSKSEIASRSKNPSQASNVHGWLRMERFCGHSQGNSIRHTKSSAQDAPRNSTLSLNSASLKLAWLRHSFSFFSPSFFLCYKF